MSSRSRPVVRLLWLAALIAATTTARADGDAERNVNNVGPSLHGVFERKAGELPDFRYSPAIKRSGISWTPQTLDVFIADPQKMVPANRMPYAGMPDADARADLIAYLLKASK